MPESFHKKIFDPVLRTSEIEIAELAPTTAPFTCVIAFFIPSNIANCFVLPVPSVFTSTVLNLAYSTKIKKTHNIKIFIKISFNYPQIHNRKS